MDKIVCNTSFIEVATMQESNNMKEEVLPVAKKPSQTGNDHHKNESTQHLLFLSTFTTRSMRLQRYALFLPIAKSISLHHPPAFFVLYGTCWLEHSQHLCNA